MSQLGRRGAFVDDLHAKRSTIASENPSFRLLPFSFTCARSLEVFLDVFNGYSKSLVIFSRETFAQSTDETRVFPVRIVSNAIRSRRSTKLREKDEEIFSEFQSFFSCQKVK